MSIGAAASILNGVRGSLIWNPTDLGNAPAYGGTYLGMSRDQVFEPRPVLDEIWAEELGAYADVFYCGERPLFTGVLRYPDADAIDTIAFKSVASGSVGSHWLFRPGGTTGNTRPGTSLFNSSGKLLFAPHAKDDHPMFIMYAAIPAIAEAARIQLSLGEEYGLAFAFYGGVDTSGRCYDTGRRGSLVL